MKKTLVANLKKATILGATAAVLMSCGGSGGSGGSGGGGSTSTYGLYDSPFISANGFINSLNSVDGAGYPYDSYMVKDQYDTIRNDEDFFVYYDAEYDEYVAVSLDYLQTIQYWDYYSSNNNLADAFRDIQDDDEFMTGLIGDGFGDDYEIVDYYGTDQFGDDVYIGFDSDELYEDEQQTKDTDLLAKAKVDKKLFEEAAKLSRALKLPAKSALELATLKKETQKMVDNAHNGEMREEDAKAMLKNIENFTGISIAEAKKAENDTHLRDQLIDKAALKLGTDVSNVENEILPILNLNI